MNLSLVLSISEYLILFSFLLYLSIWVSYDKVNADRILDLSKEFQWNFLKMPDQQRPQNDENNLLGDSGC